MAAIRIESLQLRYCASCSIICNKKIAFCRVKHCYDKEAISAHKTRICILLHKALNLNGADSELCSLSLAQSLIFKQNRTGPNRDESLFSFE